MSLLPHQDLMDRLQTPEDLQPFISQYITWAYENLHSIEACEKIVVSDKGYAGTLDMKGRMKTLKGHGGCIIDLKTQKYKNDKPSYWSAWVEQLAAYKQALDGDSKKIWLVSVTINSIEPQPLQHKVWTRQEEAMGWSSFKAAMTVWQNRRKYKPGK